MEGSFEAENPLHSLSKPKPTRDETKTHLFGSLWVRRKGQPVVQAGEGKKARNQEISFENNTTAIMGAMEGKREDPQMRTHTVGARENPGTGGPS